jgi:hypothetical protein
MDAYLEWIQQIPKHQSYSGFHILILVSCYCLVPVSVRVFPKNRFFWLVTENLEWKVWGSRGGNYED